MHSDLLCNASRNHDFGISIICFTKLYLIYSVQAVLICLLAFSTIVSSAYLGWEDGDEPVEEYPEEELDEFEYPEKKWGMSPMAARWVTEKTSGSGFCLLQKQVGQEPD